MDTKARPSERAGRGFCFWHASRPIRGSRTFVSDERVFGAHPKSRIFAPQLLLASLPRWVRAISASHSLLRGVPRLPYPPESWLGAPTGEERSPTMATNVESAHRGVPSRGRHQPRPKVLCAVDAIQDQFALQTEGQEPFDHPMAWGVDARTNLPRGRVGSVCNSMM